MRKISFLLFLTAFLVLSTFEIVHAFAQGNQDCAKCHKLSNEQAKALLIELVPKTKVLFVQSSPIAGLWEIGIDIEGKKTIIYLDYAKKHILSPATRGEIINLKTKADLTQESLEKITKVDVSKVPLKDALVLGDKNAKYKVIVFSDPD